MVALVHLGIVGQQHAGRSHRAHALRHHTYVHFGRAGQLNRRRILDAFADGDRLDIEDLNLGDEHGFLKLLVDCQTQQIRGIHIVGTQATELIHIGQVAMALSAAAEACSSAPCARR